MDDRHSLSDPRPAIVMDNDCPPTWEVDVYREGVAEPLLTLTINETTLPPRYNKKKKVVWKLPDSTDTIPSFGSDEKRRIWDLYKQEKKQQRRRKKEKNENNSQDDKKKNGEEQSAATASDETTTTTAAAAATIEPPPGIPNPSSPRPAASQYQRRKLKHSNSNGNTQEPTTAPVQQQTSPSPGLPRKESLNGHSQESAAASSAAASTAAPMAPQPSSPPPGLAPPASNGHSQESTTTAAQVVQQLQTSSLTDPSRNGDTVSPSGPPVPPPGFHPQEASPSSLPSPATTAINITTGEELNSEAQTTIENSNKTRQQPACRSFVVPPHCANIPVGIAQQVVDLYYPLVSHGGGSELVLYYTDTAQKSTSVGGAHHFCNSSHEFLLQFQSLQHSTWDVRGIVAQGGIQHSVVLLITGTMTTTATTTATNHNNANNNNTMSFCHSLTLVRDEQEPTTGGGVGGPSYRIHNDALAFLT